jgi:hypothetical protein
MNFYSLNLKHCRNSIGLVSLYCNCKTLLSLLDLVLPCSTSSQHFHYINNCEQVASSSIGQVINILIPHWTQVTFKQLRLCQGDSSTRHKMEFHMLVTPLNWHLLVMHSLRTMLMLQISKAHMDWVPCTPIYARIVHIIEP